MVRGGPARGSGTKRGAVVAGYGARRGKEVGRPTPSLWPSPASPLSFLYPSLPSGKGRVSGFLLHEVLATEEESWT